MPDCPPELADLDAVATEAITTLLANATPLPPGVRRLVISSFTAGFSAGFRLFSARIRDPQAN